MDKASCIQHPFQFDPIQTSSFVEGGYIYFSPNCTRAVPAPRQSHYTDTPFNGTTNEREQFLNPVWWTDSFGWMGYIPLAPCFTAAPFHVLCWLPKVLCIGRNSYQMDANMIEDWKNTEKKMIDACHYIRLWYGIAATTPPRPSEFGYSKAHKSAAICKIRIQVSREWFVIWFGFLSFLLAEAERRHVGTLGDVPDWYLRLQDEGYSDSWLGGLMASTVYSFTPMTPRTGVFIQVSREDKYRPPIDYLLDLHIPVWFVWTKRDEEMITKNPKLSLYVPSKQQLLDALNTVYRSAWLPSAGEIIRNYYAYEGDFKGHQIQQLRAKYAPEVIFSYLMEQMAKEFHHPSLLTPETEKPLPSQPAPPQYPQQGMVDRQSYASLSSEPTSSQIFSSWETFFEERGRRQAELIKLESPQERQVRMSRERSRGTKRARVFTWEKIATSGGQIVYARVAVTKSRNEDTLSGFTNNQRKYNAFANEWDVFEDFAPEEYLSDDEYLDDVNEFYGIKTKPSSQSQDQCLQSPNPQADTYSPAQTPAQTPAHHWMPPVSPLPGQDSNTSGHLSLNDLPMELDEDEDDKPYSLDILRSIGCQYGYVSPLCAQVAASTSLPWWKVLHAIGFAEDPKNDISDNEKASVISFIGALLSQGKPHQDLWDLDDYNCTSLASLSNIANVHCPTTNVYIFSGPTSTACRWTLAVKSAAATLYVLRIFVTNPTHNFLSVARILISRGVPFHTFLHLRDLDLGPPCLSVPFAPTALRFAGFNFTITDFEAAMVQCRQILNQPQGRAALLMGGIVWRIAKKYLSLDAALTGPSIEVTVHRSGHLVDDEKFERQFWDDALTENEMLVICGSYKLLTGHGMQQTTIKSWFPPHSVWSSIQASGQCWLEWTEVNERWFLAHLKNIETGKFQPLSAHDWREKLRRASKALTLTKKIITRNEKLALEFLDDKQA